MKMGLNSVNLVAILFILAHASFIVGIPCFIAMSNKDKAKNSVKLEINKQYMEDTCEYCGGVYIHGLHTSCPHCGAPIDSLDTPINVDLDNLH